MHVRRATAAVAVLVILAAAIASCGDGDPVGIGLPEFTISPTQGPPGTPIELRGLPASATAPGHWIEIGGEPVELFTPGGDAAYAAVPAFLTGNATWPAVPATPVTVELHNAGGAVMKSSRSFTVTPLQPADGTLAGVAEDLATVANALSAIADALPPAAGESARFAYAISRALDSLRLSPEFSVAHALAEAEATTPDFLPLADALFAASGMHLPIRDMAHRLDGVAKSLSAAEASAAAASSVAAPPAAFPAAAGSHATSPDAPRGVRDLRAHASSIEVLSDETLSMLMQLSVYLKQNTDFGVNTAKHLSTVLSIASIAGIPINWENAPIGKALSLIASYTTVQALLVNKYLVAALPSQLDSLTITLASSTLKPGERTASRVDVHASNRPERVTLGNLLSSLQTALGVRAQGDYFEKLALFLVKQINERMHSYAADNPDVTYDSNIIDLWSVPNLSFKAQVSTRKLLELHSQAPAIVEPLAAEVNWIARADTNAETKIRAEPSVGNAEIPVLVQWLANIVSTNSGPASNLVLGAFGEVLKSSEPVDVRVTTETCSVDGAGITLDFAGEHINPTVAGPVLEDGFSYFITVSGTYSIWGSMWDDGVCQGTPHQTAAGRTGFDAEYRFAVPVGSSLCDRAVPDHTSKFRISLDGGATFEHIHPVPGFYNPDHVYEYVVTGKGQAVHFMLAEDSNRGDDYGVLSIQVACPVEPED